VGRGEQDGMMGSYTIKTFTGRDGILHINWHLVHLPRKALKYAVVHELAHLKHRNHSQEFWELVEKMVPGWREYAGMMDGGL